MRGTHEGEGLGVGPGQAQLTNHLQAAVAGGQVQRSPAVLVQRDKRRGALKTWVTLSQRSRRWPQRSG